MHYTAAIEVDEEQKLNIADLLRQPSGSSLVPTGCPVEETDSNECEAILSVKSEARGDAYSDVSWQAPTLEACRVLTRHSITEQMTEQQFPFNNDIDISSEAITPPVTRESHGRLDEVHQYYYYYHYSYRKGTQI